MNWKELGKKVADFAPLLGGLLGGPAGASIGGIIAGTLGTSNNPEDISAAIAGNTEAITKLKQLELEHKEKLIQMSLEADTNRIAEVNKTMRAEYAQEDKYVKRWRPTFGYAVCLTWLITWIAITYTVIFAPASAPLVLNALSSTTTLWGVALSILGINVWKRSQDKKVQSGDKPLLDKIVDKFS